MDVGVTLRDRRLKTRDGLYACLRDGKRKGQGEISPLPGFSQESREETQTELLAQVRGWLQEDNSLPRLPPATFGASCALAGLTGVLPQDADYRAASLCMGDPDDLVLQLTDVSGERVVKTRVGLYETVRDGMVADLLLEAIPELHLRFDANRIWTLLKVQQSAEYVNLGYRGRIAFLEEPRRACDDFRAFTRETGIAITRDESLRKVDFTFEAKEGVKAVIIKPTLTDSLDRVREQMTATHTFGPTAVINSSVEPSLGLTWLA